MARIESGGWASTLEVLLGGWEPTMSETENDDRSGTEIGQGGQLTDKIGVVGLDATDYEHLETHETSVDLQHLKTAIELIETLGWQKLDVCLVHPPESDDENGPDFPMLSLRTSKPLFSAGGAVTIAPLTEKGRGGNNE